MCAEGTTPDSNKLPPKLEATACLDCLSFREGKSLALRMVGFALSIVFFSSPEEWACAKRGC